ncbi:hypothetical protein [Variovorax paradoxus]|uniref:hypothetical protein n=1 Tax=Variovorax paradoxus TaxID=34073 RepID=UPI00064ACCDF|nr:hypothetical protein [Variovorax paradoxus]
MNGKKIAPAGANGSARSDITATEARERYDIEGVGVGVGVDVDVDVDVVILWPISRNRLPTAQIAAEKNNSCPWVTGGGRAAEHRALEE